jgi:ABC-type multidrug transport system ATPase subunit
MMKETTTFSEDDYCDVEVISVDGAICSDEEENTRAEPPKRITTPATTTEEPSSPNKNNGINVAIFKSSRATGFDDPFLLREGRDLVWSNVNVTVTGKKILDRKILHNVWGEVPQRQTTAIMGPSGSGKSTLLNVLAGRVRTGGHLVVESDVRLNNFQVDPTNIDVRKKIAFVAQDDSLPVTSTPREAILFSAKLRLNKNTSDAELESLTTRMLSELGLLECADTMVGGALVKGISGGERKRTAVGVELAARPALVFLDAPTSGLDSFNAVQLCQVLSKVAHAGASVLFTIHQPSSEIFNAIDRLILLNKGRVMYQGSVRDVPDFFETRGYPVPPNYNPGDWIMNVALSHTVPDLDAAGYFPKDDRAIGTAFRSDALDCKDALGLTSHEEHAGETHVGFSVQTTLLFQREVKNVFRATHALKARVMMTCLISLVIGFIFYNVAETDYTDFINVQSTFGALLMALLANVFSTALPSLLSFPEERPVFLREYATNHYSVLPYFVSRLGMELIVTGCQVTVSSVITYFLVGFSAPYRVFWSGLYLMACASTAIGVMVGCSVEHTEQAVEFLPAMFMPQILFSGFFVPPGLIPDWLSWIRFICPLTYGVGIVLTAEFNGRCNGLEGPNLCNKVMDNAQVHAEDRWWYYLVLLVLFFAFRLQGLVALKAKSTKFY